MRDLLPQEIGFVYGAGSTGKPTSGNNKLNIEGRGKKPKVKKAKKARPPGNGSASVRQG